MPWAKSAPAFHSAMRASGSSSQPREPFGKRAVLMAIMPFSTSVKKRFCSSGTAPIATVRVMSVVPLIYCAPESMRNSVPGSRVESVSVVTR